MKIQKKSGGGGGVRGDRFGVVGCQAGVRLGDQVGCERRIEVSVKI